jgi:hypothetical protein
VPGLCRLLDQARTPHPHVIGRQMEEGTTAESDAALDRLILLH